MRHCILTADSCLTCLQVAELVNQTGLTLIPVPLGDGNNLFEYNTDTVKKGDAKSPTSGRSYNEINAAAYESYVAKHNADGSVDPYSCPVLREISVPTYLERFGMCDADEVKWWVAYSGYDLYPDEVQASIFVKDVSIMVGSVYSYNTSAGRDSLFI